MVKATARVFHRFSEALQTSLSGAAIMALRAFTDKISDA